MKIWLIHTLGNSPQGTDPAETTANPPAGAVVHTLERLVAFHARRIRLAQRAEAPLQVHMPRDIDVRVQRPCHLVFIRDYQRAILGLAGAAYEPEPLVEWETFTRALLTTQPLYIPLICAHLGCPTTSWQLLPGLQFARRKCFDLVEIEAFEDPWRDFMLRCLQYVCRLWNPQQTSVHYSEHGSVPRPGRSNQSDPRGCRRRDRPSGTQRQQASQITRINHGHAVSAAYCDLPQQRWCGPGGTMGSLV
ncbi:uncharacterized protein LOC142793223 [Rhipicephalus microplus]|uniref:uncharacterized protein LOC142793223 n=1 Tax=Rhipicephalus microplus TaxID=6941 RepID=UPI003F6C342D